MGRGRRGRGVFLANITLGLGKREGTPDQTELGRLHTSTEEYANRFPESPVFRRFTISKDDPLGDLAAVLRERHTTPQSETSKTRSPRPSYRLALAAEVHGLSVRQGLPQARGRLRVQPHPGAGGTDPAELLGSVRNRPAVMDTTAAATLLALGPTA